MAMRSQVYEWTNLAPTGSTSTLFRRSTDVPVALASGTQISVFIGGTGYNITKPAETTATQFVVIEDVALTPDGSLTQTGGLSLGRDLTVTSEGTGILLQEFLQAFQAEESLQAVREQVQEYLLQ